LLIIEGTLHVRLENKNSGGKLRSILYGKNGGKEMVEVIDIKKKIQILPYGTKCQ
jgi:hypothetical protein